MHFIKKKCLEKFFFIFSVPQRTDNEKSTMVDECFIFLKPDCSEHSQVSQSYSYARIFDLNGGGS